MHNLRAEQWQTRSKMELFNVNLRTAYEQNSKKYNELKVLPGDEKSDKIFRCMLKLIQKEQSGWRILIENFKLGPLLELWIF